MGERIEVRAPDHETECTAVLGYWYKRAGDRVEAGDDLLDYDTDKATITLEAPCAGVLAEVLVPEDTPISPGQVLGTIEAAGGEPV
ncbi:MAG TPA: lipoyl domain-containing protein [Armatimonadota bacterium]|nr:lipoyl domain-containing protein [Armatimonadota bacterium]HQK92383.1 lipoyl domain-containing protein [Armatimonadota bacterium]